LLLGIWELEISACGSVGLEQNLILAAGKKRLKLLFVILIAQSPVDNEYSKIWRDSRQCIAILNCNPFAFENLSRGYRRGRTFPMTSFGMVLLLLGLGYSGRNSEYENTEITEPMLFWIACSWINPLYDMKTSRLV
jgi:hypothetical protein